MKPLKHSSEEIKKAVRMRYTVMATAGSQQCEWEADAGKITRATYAGYDSSKIAALPGGILDTFCGCGNPLRIGRLKPGETVLDLGCGGGLDSFLAAELVGDKGKVVGLDMTKEMLRRAGMNAEKMRFRNVAFKRGEMEDIPLEDNSVDVIISNNAINLSPEKERVLGESFRVLRPGGRLMICDLVSKEDVPEEERDDLDAWAMCQSSVIKEEDYLDIIKKSGFENIRVLSKDFFEGLISIKIKADKPA
jgi:arsenite methyltransferase